MLSSTPLRKEFKENFTDLTDAEIETALTNELLARQLKQLKGINAVVGWMLAIALIIIGLSVLVALMANN